MTRPSGTAIIDLQDQEIWETINVPPDTICKDFGYDSTRGEYLPYQRRTWLLFTAKQPSISGYVNEWMVGSQTDIPKPRQPWYAAYRHFCPHFIGHPTEITTSDIAPALANNFTEISPEIKEMSENIWFNRVLTTALSEISFFLNKENYQIKVKIEEDLEIPEWKETLILIKVTKRNSKDLIRLWKAVEERVRKKIESIKEENEKEINKINENLAIFIDGLD